MGCRDAKLTEAVPACSQKKRLKDANGDEVLQGTMQSEASDDTPQSRKHGVVYLLLIVYYLGVDEDIIWHVVTALLDVYLVHSRGKSMQRPVQPVYDVKERSQTAPTVWSRRRHDTSVSNSRERSSDPRARIATRTAIKDAVEAMPLSRNEVLRMRRRNRRPAPETTALRRFFRFHRALT